MNIDTPRLLWQVFVLFLMFSTNHLRRSDVDVQWSGPIKSERESILKINLSLNLLDDFFLKIETLLYSLVWNLFFGFIDFTTEYDPDVKSKRSLASKIVVVNIMVPKIVIVKIVRLLKWSIPHYDLK